MGKTYPLIVWLLFIPSLLYAQEWVDMGVRAENGDAIYWSNSDFEIYRNGNVGFAEYGEMGSHFGWGDITGRTVGSDLSRYGGTNPPSHIEGNPQYDIITAKLGSPYRLPSFYEFNELAKNCEFSVKTIVSQRNQGKDGLPSWVQGQWMCNNAALINGQVYNASVSLKIDGVMASVYTSDNNYWEGTYSYSNGILKVWKLKLNINESDKSINDDRGYQYQKISDKTKSGKIRGMQLKSKINGNTLFFPFPDDVSSFASGGYTIVGTNTLDAEEATYWIADLCEHDKDKAYAAFLSLYENSGIIEVKRSRHNRIRAIKVDIGSGIKWMEEKRIAEQKAAEERARKEELERQRAEEERKRIEEEKREFERIRAEAYEKDPMIKALSVFDEKENILDVFDYKIYIERPESKPKYRKILLFLYSNKKTKELSKVFNEAMKDEAGPNYKYWPFVEEKFRKVLPNMLECMNNFSIRSKEGDSYEFKLDTIPEQVSYFSEEARRSYTFIEGVKLGLFKQEGCLRYKLDGKPLYFERGKPYYATCALHPICEEDGLSNLSICGIDLSIFAFLKAGLKTEKKLYYCSFELPESSSYSIIANGKTIKAELLSTKDFSQLKYGYGYTKSSYRNNTSTNRNILYDYRNDYDRLRLNDKERQQQMNRRNSLYQEERQRMQQREAQYRQATEQRRRQMQQNTQK